MDEKKELFLKILSPDREVESTTLVDGRNVLWVLSPKEEVFGFDDVDSKRVSAKFVWFGEELEVECVASGLKLPFPNARWAIKSVPVIGDSAQIWRWRSNSLDILWGGVSVFLFGWLVVNIKWSRGVFPTRVLFHATSSPRLTYADGRISVAGGLVSPFLPQGLGDEIGEGQPLIALPILCKPQWFDV